MQKLQGCFYTTLEIDDINYEENQPDAKKGNCD